MKLNFQGSFKVWIWNTLVRRIVRAPNDASVFLGTEIKKHSIFAVVPTADLWYSEPAIRKLKSIFFRRWEPVSDNLNDAGVVVLLRQVFGEEEDFGPQFLRLYNWHCLQEWSTSSLTEQDSRRAEALEAFTLVTRRRINQSTSNPPLNLSLPLRNPMLWEVSIPMVAKIPVRSCFKFLDVDASFSFNSIRAANHPCANELIAFLYEILYLQQKIAISLHEYVRLSAFSFNDKADSVLLDEEVDAIMCVDRVFSYLKASLEKTIALTGLVFQVKNLDSKNTHRSKYSALSDAMPENLKRLPYAGFLLEFLKSENIEDLTNYRTGLLHKKGISDLQPHTYAVPFDGESVDTKAIFKKVFPILHEQHSKNTAILLCSLALLTDRLVELDPPKISLEDLSQIFPPEEVLKWMGVLSRHVESQLDHERAEPEME